MTTDRWREVNRANWESRVPLHTGPGRYELDAFDDPDHLSNVVRYDLPPLGRLEGLDVVHLQCHIGTDTVGLARLGARGVTGLDFSPSALTAARALAARAKATVAFVESDLYDAVDTLGPAGFDVVYTGMGAICWLPDIARWAQVVADLLRPGGRLFIREGHPVLWSMSDPRPDGLLVVEFPYFETDGVAFSEAVTYTGEGTLAAPDIIHFNHGLARSSTRCGRPGSPSLRSMSIGKCHGTRWVTRWWPATPTTASSCSPATRTACPSATRSRLSNPPTHKHPIA